MHYREYPLFKLEFFFNELGELIVDTYKLPEGALRNALDEADPEWENTIKLELITKEIDRLSKILIEDLTRHAQSM